MKDRNRQYKKYQHIDEDRQNLNHSQVPLSLVFIQFLEILYFNSCAVRWQFANQMIVQTPAKH